MAKVCFTPIWYPVDNYATSRLRARSVVDLLAGDREWEVKIDYQADADVAVIVQLCSDRNLQSILNNPNQLVVYDICDRYFATNNVFKTDEGLLHAHTRCLQVIERANVLIASTRQLKDELSHRFPHKPCFYVPELVDYGITPQPVSKAASRRLLWFGHTTRGNFESAQWIIDHLRSDYGYRPVLVTTPATLAWRYPSYAEFCTAWSPQALLMELARAELCIVSHALDEPSKSPNRFVTATVHGVPTLVNHSPACREILETAGYGKFAINTSLDLRKAMDLLSDAVQRAAYVRDLQAEMWRQHAPQVVRAAYLELFEKIWLQHSKVD